MMLGVMNIPWSSHTDDEILEDWFSPFDSLFSFYYKRPLSLSSKSRSSSIGTHAAEMYLALTGACQLSLPANLTQIYLHRPVDFAHSTGWNLKLSKNHTKKRTFLPEVLLWQVSQTLPITFVVKTLAAGFLLFSFLSFFLLVTLPSCVLIWWALGKRNKK